MTESANDIDIIDIYPTAPVASGATLTFSYPSGRSAGSYTQDNAVLHVRGTNTSFSDVTVTYGTSNMTVTYTGATIPAGSKVSLQVELTLASEDLDGYDVREFGAVGDGVTDDTVAWQKAIAAAEGSSPLGSVRAPEGTFIVSGLTVSKSINIFGRGKLRTILKLKDGSDTHVITYTGEKTGASFETKQPLMAYVGIDGNRTNQSGTCHGVYFPDIAYSVSSDYAFSLAMFECDVKDCLSNGLRIGSNRNAGNFTRGSVRNCGSSGIHIGASSDWHFNHFGSGGNGGHGIYNVGGQMIRVIDPDIYSNDLSGIRMDDTADDIWISGGSIDRNAQHGFLINGDTGSPNDRLFTLLGVKFYQNSAETTDTYSDITLNNCFGGSTIGCIFKTSSVNSPKYLVRFSGVSGRHKFLGNTWNQASPPYATALSDDYIGLQQTRNSRVLDFTLAIAAAGANQGAATALTTEINRVETGGATGVRLPTGTYYGQRIHVTNVNGNTINVYPVTGQQINNAGANVASTLATGNGREYVWDGSASWWSLVR